MPYLPRTHRWNGSTRILQEAIPFSRALLPDAIEPATLLEGLTKESRSRDSANAIADAFANHFRRHNRARPGRGQLHVHLRQGLFVYDERSCGLRKLPRDA